MKYSFSSSKIRTIVSHEYISKVKTKGFLIGTFIAPVLLLAVISIPVIITSYSMRNTTQKVAIVDKTSTATGEKIVKNDVNKFFLATGTEEQLRTRVLDQEIDGFLILTDNSVKEGKITVYTKGGGGLSFLESLDRNLGKIIRTERLLAAGADAKIIDIVKEGIDVKTEVVTAKGSVEDTSLASAGIGYVFGLLLYMMMLMYGSFVMRGVIEEKANRIIEIIASSARPFEIMLGKVIGIGSVGLTQVLIWVILSLIILAFGGSVANIFMDNSNMAMGMQAQQQAFQMPHISPWLFVSFIFYFLAGYFIYATLYAAVGSAVDQESDAQQLMIPVMVPIILPILFIGSVISDPNSTLAVVLSVFPLFAPILMIVRIAATEVPLWQIILSTILILLTFLGAIWVAARIYRVGILMYGKKPNLKDMLKWIKVAN